MNFQIKMNIKFNLIIILYNYFSLKLLITFNMPHLRTNNNKWNIDPEHFLTMKSDEIWIYWKDSKSHYLDCNELMMTELGFTSKGEIIGRNDYDFFVSKTEADLYRQEDQQVIKSNRSLQFKESASLSKHIIQFETIKIPVFKKNKNYGLIGLSYYKKIQISDKPWMQLAINKDVSKIKLSAKELEILYYILLGKTAKEISSLIFRSLRTIEKHIENIKWKSDSPSKSVLIQKFIHLIISLK